MDNIIVVTDSVLIEQMKQNGFKVAKVENYGTLFYNNSQLKFNFDNYKGKFTFTNKLNF